MLHTLHRSPWLTDFAALLRLLVRLTVKHSSQMAW